MNEYLMWFLVGVYFLACIMLGQFFYSLGDKHPDDRTTFPGFMRPFELAFGKLSDGFRKMGDAMAGFRK